MRKRVLAWTVCAACFVTSSIALAAPAGTQIALYSDEGVFEDGLIASEAMWKYLGAQTERLSAADIKAGGLTGFHVLEVPGGWAADYAVALGSEGYGAIQTFVYDGGGYVGFCAGAYLATYRMRWEGQPVRYGMGLLRVAAIGPLDDIAVWPDYAMTAIDYLPHEVTQGLPDPSEVLYYGGAFFVPLPLSGISTVATYLDPSVFGTAAMVTGSYGAGRVYLSGPHPEFEEGSDRDGVTGWDDLLEDPESDWPLMGQVLDWMVSP